MCSHCARVIQSFRVKDRLVSAEFSRGSRQKKRFLKKTFENWRQNIAQDQIGAELAAVAANYGAWSFFEFYGYLREGHWKAAYESPITVYRRRLSPEAKEAYEALHLSWRHTLLEALSSEDAKHCGQIWPDQPPWLLGGDVRDFHHAFRLEEWSDENKRAYWDGHHTASAASKFRIHQDLIEKMIQSLGGDVDIWGKRIWFPGCGKDLTPRFFAGYGAQVWATDWSSVVIQMQHQLMKWPLHQLCPLPQSALSTTPFHSVSTLTLGVLDDRAEAPVNLLDFIISIGVWDHFEQQELEQTAQCYFNALGEQGCLFVCRDRYKSVRYEDKGNMEEIQNILHKTGFAVIGLGEWNLLRETLRQYPWKIEEEPEIKSFTCTYHTQYESEREIFEKIRTRFFERLKVAEQQDLKKAKEEGKRIAWII